MGLLKIPWLLNNVFWCDLTKKKITEKYTNVGGGFAFIPSHPDTK